MAEERKKGGGVERRCEFGWAARHLRFVADHRLHHERVLEVTDVVAVLRVALVDACEGGRHRERREERGRW